MNNVFVCCILADNDQEIYICKSKVSAIIAVNGGAEYYDIIMDNGLTHRVYAMTEDGYNVTDLLID